MLKDLVNEVMDISFSPQDIYEVCAILESLGWNDSRAQEHYGAEDVFELAGFVWDQMDPGSHSVEFEKPEKRKFFESIRDMMQSFLRGLIFALPMGLSILSMLTLRFSLWSYQYLSTELATSIAIGTILSFMTVGGFTQAIARRGFFYIGQNFYNMAKKTTFYLVKLGYLVCITVAVLYIIINTVYYNFGLQMMSVILAYFLFLSANWLSVTVMNILKRQFTFTGLLLLGILLVYFFFRILKINIIISQLIALVIVSIIGYVLILYYFDKESARHDQVISPPLPKRSIMLNSLGPYFAYGFFFFTFLFVDRIIAWSTNNNYMPYIIWFRGDYELGLDFALLTLILPIAFGELIINELMKRLSLTLKNALNYEKTELNKEYILYYLSSMVLSFLSTVVSTVLIVLLVRYIVYYAPESLRTTYFFNDITWRVFYIALGSYSLLVIGLMNVMILFSLSQPHAAVKIMVRALLVNFLSGFFFSRWLSFEYAVLGLLFGVIVMVVLSIVQVLKLFKNLDYHLYAAM